MHMSMALISLISVCQGTAAKNRLKDLCWQFMKFLILHSTHFPAFHCKKEQKIFPEGDLKGNFVIFSHLTSLYPPNNKIVIRCRYKKSFGCTKMLNIQKIHKRNEKGRKKIDLKAISAEICTNFLFMNCEFIFL